MYGRYYVTGREYNNCPPNTLVKVTEDISVTVAGKKTAGWVKIKWFNESEQLREMTINTKRMSAARVIFDNPWLKPRSKEEYIKEKLRDYSQ